MTPPITVPIGGLYVAAQSAQGDRVFAAIMGVGTIVLALLTLRLAWEVFRDAR